MAIYSLRCNTCKRQSITEWSSHCIHTICKAAFSNESSAHICHALLRIFDKFWYWGGHEWQCIDTVVEKRNTVIFKISELMKTDTLHTDTCRGTNSIMFCIKFARMLRWSILKPILPMLKYRDSLRTAWPVEGIRVIWGISLGNHESTFK